MPIGATVNFYVQVNPVIDKSVIALCRKPYHGHPKGCPNWDKNDRCPTKVGLIESIFDLSLPIFAIYNKFDFRAHKDRLRKKRESEGKSPFTQRQLECCLYWQGTARKQLKAKIADFKKAHGNLVILDTPEATGVNVTETMRAIGIELEWPPINYTYQVVLAGHQRYYF